LLYAGKPELVLFPVSYAKLRDFSLSKNVKYFVKTFVMLIFLYWLELAVSAIFDTVNTA